MDMVNYFWTTGFKEAIKKGYGFCGTGKEILRWLEGSQVVLLNQLQTEQRPSTPDEFLRRGRDVRSLTTYDGNRSTKEPEVLPNEGFREGSDGTGAGCSVQVTEGFLECQ